MKRNEQFWVLRFRSTGFAMVLLAVFFAAIVIWIAPKQLSQMMPFQKNPMFETIVPFILGQLRNFFSIINGGLVLVAGGQIVHLMIRQRSSRKLFKASK